MHTTGLSAIGDDAVARDPDEVALVHLAGVGHRVAHRPGDLGRHDPAPPTRTWRPRSPRRRRPGRRPAGRRSPRRWTRSPPPAPSCRSSASTCSATGRMFLLLGRITTSSEPTASTALTRSAVAGFIVWPPTTRWWTPRERKMRPMPSPETTATTLVVGGGPVPSTLGPGPGRAHALAHPALLLDLLVEVGHPDALRAPGVTPASMAAPMSSVWMWQFHRPSPPTTTMESPMPGPHLLEGLDGVVGRGEEVHDLVAQVADRVLAVARPRALRPAGGPAPVERREVRAPATPEGSGSGRPSSTRRNASSRRRNPAPPASTTPAWASTGSISGVRASASAASLAGALHDAHEAATRSPRPPPPPRRRSGSSPRPGAPRPAGPARRRGRWRRPAGRGRRPPPRPAAMRSLMPRRSWERITPGVAPGPHQRAVADGLADLGQRRPRARRRPAR